MSLRSRPSSFSGSQTPSTMLIRRSGHKPLWVQTSTISKGSALVQSFRPPCRPSTTRWYLLRAASSTCAAALLLCRSTCKTSTGASDRILPSASGSRASCPFRQVWDWCCSGLQQSVPFRTESCRSNFSTRLEWTRHLCSVVASQMLVTRR